MKQYTIQNKYISLTVLEYGAIIQKLVVKDKNGEDLNVVVGYDKPEAYLKDGHALGACIGRFAGRISHGGFELDGEFFPLFANNGIHLHGGRQGFGKKYWTVMEETKGDVDSITLGYKSEHLEEGYPGNLTATVTYRLLGNSLTIIHKAETDRATVVNMTNHSYFRLDQEASIDHYHMKLNATGILEVDDQLLPTGKIIETENIPHHLLEGKPIDGVRLDTPFIFEPNCNDAVTVSSGVSGIVMKVQTNQPSIVIYTPADFPSICFETQNYPDAPNHINFPSSVLRPGKTYTNTSTFTFEIQ